MVDFLLTPAGKAYLLEEYVRLEKSIYAVAKQVGTYPVHVYRALQWHGIPRRTKSAAQKAALRSARHPHPTRGRPRPDYVKVKISRTRRRTRADGPPPG